MILLILYGVKNSFPPNILTEDSEKNGEFRNTTGHICAQLKCSRDHYVTHATQRHTRTKQDRDQRREYTSECIVFCWVKQKEGGLLKPMYVFIWDAVRQFACLHSQRNDTRQLKLKCNSFCVRFFCTFLQFSRANMLVDLKSVLFKQGNGKWSTDETIFLNCN
jgi:hypothetical protein